LEPKYKTILLDRDGTINVDTGTVYAIDDWAFADGAVEALGILQRAGYALAVVTNQAAVADGRSSEEKVGAVHGHMLRELERVGVRVDAVAYCPHRADAGCACRKPRSGMLDSIEEQLGAIDRQGSWMVGDKESDIGFGRTVGVQTSLIRSRYWDSDNLTVKPDQIVDSLLEFAQFIVAPS
jgi:D-glycero-D-manno-heptose 1,7-bisphosphate phosphatase